LKKSQAVLLKEVNTAKNDRFCESLQGLNFKTNSIRTHNFISKLNDVEPKKSNQALSHNGKLLTSNSSKAKAFNKFYALNSTKSTKLQRYQKYISLKISL
jgi:hypothetical protein